MARNQKLQVDIEANDKASGKIEKVADKADKLDKADPNVKVTADTSGALDDLSQVDGKIGDLAGRLQDIGRLGGPAGLVGATATAMALIGDHAADAAIEVDDIAKLTGDSLDLTSRLSGVWKQSGADAKDLQDVLLQMAGVLESDADLAKRLGVNVNDGKSHGERFLQVVEALSREFDNTAERSVVASKLFGEEGVRQVNAVTAAHGDLSAAVEEYNGQVFTAQDVADARDYKQQLAEIKAEFESIAVDVGQGIVPGLGDMLGLITDINNSTKGNPQDKGLFGTLLDAGSAPFRGLVAYSEATLDFIGVTDDAMVSSNEFTEAIAKQTRETLDAEVASLKQAAALADNTREQTYNADANEEMGRIQAATTRVVDAARRAQERLRDALKFSRDEVGKLKREIDDQQAWLSMQDAFDRTNETLADTETTTRDAMSAVLELKEATIEYAESINLPDRVVTNLVAQIDAGKAAEVQAFLERIQNGVTLPIRPEVRGSFNKASAARGGPTLTSEGNLIPRAARASGGPVAAGSTYLVGEQGPELLTMGSQSGNVIPNDKIGGGDTYNLTVNVTTSGKPDPNEFGRLVREAIRRESRWSGPVSGWTA